MTLSRLMIVEDERITAASLALQLKKLGHSVVANVATGEAAVAAAERERPDCVLMDIHLAGAMDGIAAGREILERWQIPVIYLTAYADDETLTRAGKTAPYGYLVKPFEIRGVEAALRMASARRAAEADLAASEARLKLALEAARLSDFEIDPDAGKLRCHRHTPSLAALPPLRDYALSELFAKVHPDDRARADAALQNGQAGALVDLEFRLGSSSGGNEVERERWLRITGKRIGDARIFGVVEDVTLRHENQTRLAQAARIVESASEAIFVTDDDWRFESANPAYYSLVDADARTGETPTVLAQLDAQTLAQLRAEIGRSGVWRGELTLSLADTPPRIFWASLARPAAPESGLIGVLADISQLKSAQARVEALAYHDALTGLPNRTLAHDRLEQAILRAERNKTSLALLFIDLDHFKAVNDRYGHAAGDGVLIEVARRMQSVVRRSDTLARLSGDEFLVITEGGEQSEAVFSVADKLLQALAQPCAVGGQPVNCGASIGVADYPADGDNADALLRAADLAMYQAKAEGGMRYRAFNPTMFDALLPVWRIEAELRRALLHGEFVLYYQPQRDLDGRVVGAEALARWQHPERGLLQPDSFIDALERMGLMETFTAWVLRDACAQLANWRAAGHPITRVAINVPPSALQHCGIASLIEETLARYSLPGDCLEIEITESALQNGLDATACLDRITATGSSIVLDDFGAGYASLSSLKHLPLARMKIDREFVRDIETHARSAAIVETLLELAARFGIEVLAEGVETATQLAILRRLGCRHFQGFLFDRPLPVAQLADLSNPA